MHCERAVNYDVFDKREKRIRKKEKKKKKLVRTLVMIYRSN